MTSGPPPDRLLTVVVCGAGPAGEVTKLVDLAHERGWAVEIIATPAALAFIDEAKLEALTGNPVRSEYRTRGERRPRVLSSAKATIVAPATYNTICKLALGISDTYALGTVAERVGGDLPVVILPFVNSALASRRPFVRAVESLRDEGVRVLLGPGQWVPHPAGEGGPRIASFPWALALDELAT